MNCLICCLIFNSSSFIFRSPVWSSLTSCCLFIRSRNVILVAHTEIIMESMWLFKKIKNLYKLQRAPRGPSCCHLSSAVRLCWPATSKLSPCCLSDLPEKLQKLGVEVASREGMECSALELNAVALPLISEQYRIIGAPGTVLVFTAHWYFYITDTIEITMVS